MTAKLTPIRLYVSAVVVAATAAATLSWFARGAYPGGWGIAVLIAAGAMLEMSATYLRGGKEAIGSLAFVVYIAAGIMFGPFWGSIVVAASTLLGQIHAKRPLIKS